MDSRKELALLPLEDEEAGRLLGAVTGERRGECWWLILRDGTPVAGDEGGGVMLLTEVRLSRALGRVLRAFRLSPLIDALDRLLSQYRKRLGRFVPEGPAPRRYP